MRKIIIATLATFLIGTAALVQQAEARCWWNGYHWHCWYPGHAWWWRHNHPYWHHYYGWGYGPHWRPAYWYP